MKKRNRNLLIVVLVQFAIIVLLSFSGSNSGKLDYDTQLFTIKDTAAIDKVIMTFEDQEVQLTNVNGSWFINGKEQADKSLIVYLKSIVNRAEVKRPISSKEKETVLASLKKEGVLVKFYSGDEILKELYAGGNEGKTKNYFSDESNPYIVGVPGNQRYFNGVFKLKPHQWKERLIARSSWRTISSIDVQKKSGDGFKVYFTGQDLSIENINPLDTNNMMNYVSQFSQFQINEFVIPGQFDKYDSLAKTEPIAVLTLEDIDISKNFQLKVFPRLPQEGYHLITDAKNRMMMVDARRVAGLIPPKTVFIKREKFQR